MKINYQSIGSGGGIRQLSEQTVDFGATDAPMSDAELAKAKGGPIMHIPTVRGAVVVTYNVPELRTPLRLDGTTLADIFLGKITRWNDPASPCSIAARRFPRPISSSCIAAWHELGIAAPPRVIAQPATSGCGR